MEMIHFHVVTLFPSIVKPYLSDSIIGRAIREKRIAVSFYNPRDYSKDKWKKTDGRPYGGGPGMVMQVEPIVRVVDAIKKKAKKNKITIIMFNPSGKLFDSKEASLKAQGGGHIILIAGRYEGIDARVKKILKAKEVSVGPYVLTGGELPALILVDAISRQVSGVLGNELSLEEDRISSSDVYTRPENYVHKKKNYRVPKVLLSGNHAQINQWKLKRSAPFLKRRNRASLEGSSDSGKVA